MSYCKNCGEELNTGANYCPHCGEPTSKSSEVEQKSKDTEVKTTGKPQAQNVTSPAKKTRVAHKRKKKEPIHYDWWIKIALVIGMCLLIYSLFDISTSSLILWGTNILGCVSILYASIMILLGKSEIDNYGAKMLAIVSLLWLPVLKGMDYLATSVDTKERVEKSVNSSDVISSNDSRMTQQEQQNSGKNGSTITEQKKKEDAKRTEELKEYLGTYFFAYSPPGMPSSVPFCYNIILKANGTFSFEGRNEMTKKQMDIEAVVDGRDYPSGGKWSVVNIPDIKGVWLDFEGSWGRGSINLDNNVLEIPNMNGYKLKVRIQKD